MIAALEYSEVSGTVVIPGSKSMMQRALALALLHNGKTIIQNPGRSKDDQAAMQIIQLAGARIEDVSDTIIVHSNGIPEPFNQISAGESGLSVRMFAPILASSNRPFILTGTSTLMKRPMRELESIFNKLNIQCRSNSGFLPLEIQGPLIPKSIQLDGSKSSQYLTGLLFAYGATAKEEVTIHVQNLVSKPYIDLSLNMMKLFGMQVVNNHYEHFIISPRKSTHAELNIAIEADWSSGAFFIVSSLLSGDLILSGLNAGSLQGDQRILDAVKLSGGKFHFSDQYLHVYKTENLSAFEFDASDCPDLFPPLTALALFSEGTTLIKGVHRLFEKESNRAQTLIDEMSKFGAAINIENDQFVISGNQPLRTAAVKAHQDHRIAMALSVVALKLVGTTMVEEAESVQKSFPDFFNLLIKTGAAVKLIK